MGQGGKGSSDGWQYTHPDSGIERVTAGPAQVSFYTYQQTRKECEALKSQGRNTQVTGAESHNGLGRLGTR